ncbi:Dbl homology domain-containing protein, partial [Backusella circina FSU 941]
MPPFICPTFEEIEAKQWAFDTVEKILTNVEPVSFGSTEIQDNNEEEKRKTTAATDHRSAIRRSFSVLEESLFGPVDHINTAINSRRANSTIVVTTQSEPCTPVVGLSPQPSLSSRIRHTWHIEGGSMKQQLLNSFDNFNSAEHRQSIREKKVLHIWKETCARYMMEPPASLIIKSKANSKNSEQLLKFIASELVTTEETYLCHLKTIKKYYMDPLIEAASKNQKFLVNRKDIDTIFAFVPQLIAISSALIEQLKSIIAYESIVSIGKAFCELEKYFGVYIAFTINYPKSRKYLEKASSTIAYRQLIQDSARRRTANKMLLSDYMIAPIQRIMRYCLLLKDILKHSDPSHPDYSQLDKSLKYMAALASSMDTAQKKC